MIEIRVINEVMSLSNNNLFFYLKIISKLLELSKGMCLDGIHIKTFL